MFAPETKEHPESKKTKNTQKKMSTKTEQKETAEEAFKRTTEEAYLELQKLMGNINKLRSDGLMMKGAKDWGYAGSMGKVVADLKEINSFLA